MAPNGVANGFSAKRQPDLHLVVRPSHAPLHDYVQVINLSHQSDEDAVYEQDILRDPGSTKPWLAYIEFKLQHGTVHEQAFVIERACLQLPRSYKLWKLVSIGPEPLH